MKRRQEFNNVSDWQKYLGNYGEKRFAEECARRNINFVRIENETYDGLVEINGAYKKVQIKAVSPEVSSNKSEHYIYLSKRENYKNGSFDYLALYVYQYDKFYLIPVDESFLQKYSSQKITFFDTDFRQILPTRGTPIEITKYKNW